MVGDTRRREFSDTVREAVSKAGGLVSAALVLAGAAVALALAVLVLALRTRKAISGAS